MVLRHLIREAEFRSVDMGYGTPAYRYRATNTIVQKGKVLLFRRSIANRARILAHSSYSSAVNLIKARREAARAAERASVRLKAKPAKLAYIGLRDFESCPNAGMRRNA